MKCQFHHRSVILVLFLLGLFWKRPDLVGFQCVFEVALLPYGAIFTILES
jgi:hypothetical protein